MCVLETFHEEDQIKLLIRLILLETQIVNRRVGRQLPPGDLIQERGGRQALDPSPSVQEALGDHPAAATDIQNVVCIHGHMTEEVVRVPLLSLPEVPDVDGLAPSLFKPL